jgi:hypothetical protein
VREFEVSRPVRGELPVLDRRQKRLIEQLQRWFAMLKVRAHVRRSSFEGVS